MAAAGSDVDAQQVEGDQALGRGDATQVADVPVDHEASAVRKVGVHVAGLVEDDRDAAEDGDEDGDPVGSREDEATATFAEEPGKQDVAVQR